MYVYECCLPAEEGIRSILEDCAPPSIMGSDALFGVSEEATVYSQT